MSNRPRLASASARPSGRVVRRSVAALAVAGLLSLSACSEDSPEEPTPSADASSPDEAAPTDAPDAQPGATEPDLEGIPNPVAEVNGEPITRAEFIRAYEIQFQSFSAQAQSTGTPVDQEQLKTQTAESLVGNELLDQEADRRNITADQGLIDQEIEDLLQQNGLSSQAELEPLLAQQDLTLQDLLDQVETQVRVNQLIFAVDPDARTVSGQEVQALYAQASEQAEQTSQAIPPLPQVRDEIVDQIRTEKTGEAAQELADTLREEGEVDLRL